MHRSWDPDVMYNVIFANVRELIHLRAGNGLVADKREKKVA